MILRQPAAFQACTCAARHCRGAAPCRTPAQQHSPTCLTPRRDPGEYPKGIPITERECGGVRWGWGSCFPQGKALRIPVRFPPQDSPKPSCSDTGPIRSRQHGVQLPQPTGSGAVRHAVGHWAQRNPVNFGMLAGVSFPRCAEPTRQDGRDCMNPEPEPLDAASGVRCRPPAFASGLFYSAETRAARRHVTTGQ